MTAQPTIRAFLGGSFDPVHHSHLQMATQVHQTLSQFTQNSANIIVSLMPTKGNPFKGKPTDERHRLQMLQLATQGTPISIETCELERTPPIYTIDSVRTLKATYPNDRLIFILGQDSLHALPTWKDGLEISNFVNIWAFSRGDFTTHHDVDASILCRMTEDLTQFLNQDGAIYQDNTPIEAMSSTHIRHLLAQQNPQVAKFIPKSVLDYISKHALY